MSPQSSKRASRRDTSRDREPAELVTLAISVLLLLAIVGGIAFLEVSRGDTPARLEVRPAWSGTFRHDGVWYLPITVENTGDRPTDNVTVALERPQPGEPPEVTEAEFEFLAGGEEAEAVVAFDERPDEGVIDIDIVSYTIP